MSLCDLLLDLEKRGAGRQTSRVAHTQAAVLIEANWCRLNGEGARLQEAPSVCEAPMLAELWSELSEAIAGGCLVTGRRAFAAGVHQRDTACMGQRTRDIRISMASSSFNGC